MAAGGLLAGSVNVANAATSSVSGANAAKNIGLQIYSLTVGGDQEFVKDVAGGLKKVAAMGYATLELAGYNDGKVGAVPIRDFNKMAQDAGLKIVSTHVNPPVNMYSPRNIEQIKEFWKKAAADHAAIGCKYLIQPGQPQTRNTEDIKMICEVFNEAGKIAKAAGLIWGYHNHDGEFATVIPGGMEGFTGRRRPSTPGAQIIYDGYLEGTDPELVQFEMDVYWTVMGQKDPVDYMKKHANRIRVLHIKDEKVLGESGMMNFQKIYETAYANGIQDFFVELENYPEGTQMEGVKGCADYLLKASFVK